MKLPTAYPVKNRPGLWAAKGVDPSTLKRKTYYAKCPEEATRLAYGSFANEQEYKLFDFYSRVYLPTVKHRSENWLNQIAWTMDRYVLPRFGDHDIREIKRAELQQFFNDLAVTLKPTTVSKMKIVFSGVLRLAIADELIQSNPSEFVRLREPRREEKTVLTLDELRRLIEASPEVIRPFVLLTGCCGLRRGEALGVTKGAISRGGVLSIRQQVQQLRGGAVVSPKLKTENSYREIPLPSGLLNQLLGFNSGSSIWVCSDSNSGGFLRPTLILKKLTEACTIAKVPRVSPHELRHTFISLMDNDIEAPRTVVMALAGHAPQSTTDGYSHVKIEQKIRWMNRFWDQVSTVCVPEQWATRA